MTLGMAAAGSTSMRRAAKRVVTLTLPWPPSVNSYWRHNRGRTHISTEGKKFRKAVIEAALLKRNALEGRGPLNGALEIVVMAYPPDRRRRDLDNVLKALLDGLEHGGVYHDDSQVRRLVAEKFEPVDGGRVLVSVQEKA